MSTGIPYPSAALLRSIQDQNKHSSIEKDVSDQSLMLQRQQQVVAIQQQILKAQIQSQLLGKYAGHNGLVGLNNGYTNNVSYMFLYYITKISIINPVKFYFFFANYVVI